MLIGICGKSGSGKSSLANYLKEIYGSQVVHLDIDKIGHRALEDDEVRERLVSTFGRDIVVDGKISRKKLSTIVFDSEDEMAKLSEITWGYMDREIESFINRNCGKIILLDWQLLPKCRYFEMCDLRVLLDIPYEVRLERCMKRDSISEDVFALREKASVKYDLSSFDQVLNDNNYKDVKELVKLI